MLARRPKSPAAAELLCPSGGGGERVGGPAARLGGGVNPRQGHAMRPSTWMPTTPARRRVAEGPCHRRQPQNSGRPGALLCAGGGGILLRRFRVCRRPQGDRLRSGETWVESWFLPQLLLLLLLSPGPATTQGDAAVPNPQGSGRLTPFLFMPHASTGPRETAAVQQGATSRGDRYCCVAQRWVSSVPQHLIQSESPERKGKG